MHIEGLDELDNRIIEIIKDNARLTYSEIGAKAGVSRISVKKRMEALEKKGIIQGYKAVIDSTKIPEGVRFLLDLETTPECFEDIVEWLARCKHIRQLCLIREALKEALPEAEERISWSMPTYWKEHNILHFASSKKHIGLYPGPEAVVEFSQELKNYKTDKGTIRIPYGKVDTELIKRIAIWCYDTGNHA